MLWKVAAAFLMILFAGPAAAEGPRASFGFATHYQMGAAGQGEALVHQIVAGGPAERAGIQPGDLIVAFNGVGFRFADEYEFMRSLEAFEPGRPISLQVERGGQAVSARLTPGPLGPQQVEALAGYMARLSSCVKTGKDCPCPLDHPGHDGRSGRDDFRSPYRRFTNDIAREGGSTVLTFSRDAGGALSYRSDPVALPPEFEVGPDDDGMLWQQIEMLRKGDTLEVKISAESTDRWRVSILKGPNPPR